LRPRWTPDLVAIKSRVNIDRQFLQDLKNEVDVLLQVKRRLSRAADVARRAIALSGRLARRWGALVPDEDQALGVKAKELRHLGGPMLREAVAAQG
jgi:hypothetical protein